MNTKEIASRLSNYLPAPSLGGIASLIVEKNVSFRVAPDRKSKLGDYRPPFGGKGHRISVNGSLNPYAFLITTLHELAHLLTWEQWRNRVQPHGEEWQRNFRAVAQPYLKGGVFPKELSQAFSRYLVRPASATCRDEALLRILKSYDLRRNPSECLLEALKQGSYFSIEGGRKFRRENKLRKYIRCVEVETGQSFRFPPLTEVTPLENAPISHHPTKDSEGWTPLHLLPLGSSFVTRNKLHLIKGKLLRKNYLCQELGTSRQFKVSANLLVKAVT